MLLKYKGVLFDSWEKSEDIDGEKCIWSEICQKHVEEYWDALSQEVDYEGSALGSCGVCGCEATGDKEDSPMYYIDFNMDEVEFIE